MKDLINRRTGNLIIWAYIILPVLKKETTRLQYFREEATSVLAGFHAGSLSWTNWKLACEPGESPLEQGENQQQKQPTYGTGPESNPGHIGERRVLSPLHHPCHPFYQSVLANSQPPIYTDHKLIDVVWSTRCHRKELRMISIVYLYNITVR